MAASIQIITDLTTCTNTASTAATQVLANAAAGPIQDITGNIALALEMAKELKQLLNKIQAVEDAADPNKTRFTNILLSLT